MSKGYLVLENGAVFEGQRFGTPGEHTGELVFQTGVVGYLKTLTDPSYFGQIVLQTFPSIGCYGVIDGELDGKCFLSGYVVREWCPTPSNFRSETTLDDYLKAQGIPGLCGVDTRQITRILREEGTMNAKICSTVPENLAALKDFRIIGAVESVSVKKQYEIPAQGREHFHVAMLDLGAKYNIPGELSARGCRVTVFPPQTTASEILAAAPDGLLLPGGPGNPTENTALIDQLCLLLGKLPIFGIGLGHQLLALAAGGKTYRLPYGHRGTNQPVSESGSSRTYLTSQNHGYAVDGKTLSCGTVRFFNHNDGSCEGIDYPDLSAFSVQFVPEVCKGPQDMSFLYDEFVARMGGNH